ncbi:LodA/GoxA family CTQ-dependent oxidase [Pedobacter sp. CFBP9032]|nr:LodA/GoxA family CTQ-dependent oxidase [Pedobacter sp. CFBP9032]
MLRRLFYISLAAILFTIKKIDNMSEIKQVITHAAIRVARVGNSPDEYLLLPDLINEPITDPGNFRDAEGRIRR